MHQQCNNVSYKNPESLKIKTIDSNYNLMQLKGTKHTSYLTDILVARNRNSFPLKYVVPKQKGVLFLLLSFLSFLSSSSSDGDKWKPTTRERERERERERKPEERS